MNTIDRAAVRPSTDVPFYADPRWVARVPLLATALLQAANVAQVLRMWSAGSAEGQSLAGWLLVSVALALYYWFYRVCTPEQVWARWASSAGLIVNACVIATILTLQF